MAYNMGTWGSGKPASSNNSGSTLAGTGGRPPVVDLDQVFASASAASIKTVSKQVTPGNGAPVYQTAAEVRAAMYSGALTYNQACEKLKSQFGYSDNDCQDYLVSQTPVIPPGYYVPPTGPAVKPGDFDGDGIPNLYDPDHYVSEDPNAEDSNLPGSDDDCNNGNCDAPYSWTANQWHIITGIVVVGIIYQYYWKRGGN